MYELYLTKTAIFLKSKQRSPRMLEQQIPGLCVIEEGADSAGGERSGLLMGLPLTRQTLAKVLNISHYLTEVSSQLVSRSNATISQGGYELHAWELGLEASTSGQNLGLLGHAQVCCTSGNQTHKGEQKKHKSAHKRNKMP